MKGKILQISNVIFIKIFSNQDQYSENLYMDIYNGFVGLSYNFQLLLIV